MRFETESGSIYEVNPDEKKIRCLNKDNEWKNYNFLTWNPFYPEENITVDCCAWIAWLPEEVKDISPFTQTSNIVKIYLDK